MGREPTLPPKQQGWHEAGFTAKPQPRGADDDAANRHTSFQGPRSCTGFGYRIHTLGTPVSSHRGPSCRRASCRRAGAGPGLQAPRSTLFVGAVRVRGPTWEVTEADEMGFQFI